MKKRKLNAFLAFILAAFILLPVTEQSLAAESSKINIDQIFTYLPDIKVVFHYMGDDNTGAGEQKIPNAVLKYGDRNLKTEEMEPASSYPLEVTFLIDVSTSMNQNLFETLKEKLQTLFNEKAINTRYRLVTMGENKNVILKGDENKEDAIAAIKGIQLKDENSIFWGPVGSELDCLKNKPEFSRRAMLVFTDGIELKKGGETTYSEIEKTLETGGVPIYVFAINSNQENADFLGEMARKTGGDFVLIRSGDDLNSGLDKTIDYMSNSYVLTSKCNNLKYEENKIILAIGADKAERNIYPNVKEDQDAPQIEEITWHNKELTILFSEPVINSENIQAYTVNREGKDYKVESVRPSIDQQRITIVLERPLYNGKYTLTANGIADIFANRMLSEEPTEFTVNDQPYTFKAFLEDCWWYLLIMVIVCAAAVITIVLLRRKKNTVPEKHSGKIYMGQNLEHVRIERMGGKDVLLSISGRNLVRRNVKINVAGTIIIGRLGSCDVSIDDPQVSRQNTALIYQNNKLYVRNLSETNGTMLNGMALCEVREIQPGDTLIMGDTKIVVSY